MNAALWLCSRAPHRAGTLDVEECRHMVRIGLRIAEEDVSDVDLNKLVAALDDDGGGEKMVPQEAIEIDA